MRKYFDYFMTIVSLWVIVDNTKYITGGAIGILSYTISIFLGGVILVSAFNWWMRNIDKIDI